MPQLPRIRLFEDSAGATHATIDAEVDEAGALVVSGMDVGVTTEEIDSGEFGLRVPEADRVLLLLLKDRFGGKATVLDDLEAWLSDHGISYDIGA